MSNYNDIYSYLGALGYHEGSIDLVAIIKDNPRQGISPATLSEIQPYHIIPADSFNLKLDQMPKTETRYAGEGAESNTFMIPNISVKADFTIPFQIPAIGYIDPVLALLWDYCKLAYWGTAGIAKARITSCSYDSINITNIADFMVFNTISSTATLTDSNGTTEQLTISSVDKKNRKVTFTSPLQNTYSDEAEVIAYTPRASSVIREPAFSLVSLREGYLSPCLVNKLSIDIQAGEPIKVTVEIAALNIHRKQQMDLRQNLSTILASFGKSNRVSQIMNGTMVKISPASSASGSFGLEVPVGDCLTEGFQGLDLPLNYITGITINIENNLGEIYTSHSVKTDLQQRRRENSFPAALYCKGRKVSGSIKYTHPLEPMAFAERLAGPSALNGGGLNLIIDGIKIGIPEMVWSPSSSNAKATEDQQREINWALVAGTYNSMPTIESI